MAGIYDIAARLDTQGVLGPARLNASRIALSEQEAREAPLRFQREQETWRREDEDRGIQQQMAEYGRLMGEASRVIGVSQTPQSLERNLRKILGETANNPFWSSVLAEAAQTYADPEKFQALRTDLGATLTNVGELYKSQLETRKESTKQAEMTERAREEIAGRQSVAETAAASRERVADRRAAAQIKVQQMKNDLAENKAQETGISPLDLTRVYDQAEQNLKAREGWDEKEKIWSSDSKYWQTEKKYRAGMDFLAKDRDYLDYEALQKDLDAEVDRLLGESGYSRTDGGVQKRGAQGEGNRIVVDY